VPARRSPNDSKNQLVIRGARGNNLKTIDVSIPIGLFTCVTGVSGSGKSTLINDSLYAAAARHLYGSNLEPAPCAGIDGLARFGQFCIDLKLAAAMRGEVSRGLFFRGASKLPFGNAVRSVRELMDYLLHGEMPAAA